MHSPTHGRPSVTAPVQGSPHGFPQQPRRESGGGRPPVHTGVRENAPDAAEAAAEVARCRTRIDELDRQVIELLLERASLSGQIQRTRMSTGGTRLSLARETQVIDHYLEALGRPGAEMAMLVLRISRGTQAGGASAAR